MRSDRITAADFTDIFLGICVGAIFWGVVAAAFGYTPMDAARRMLANRPKVFYLLSDDGAKDGLTDGDREALLVRFLTEQDK